MSDGTMGIARTVAELRATLAAARHAGARIGLVPTMGAFHEGHLSLMRRARDECALVVVSLFVNPAQFNDPADLAAYPRNDARDEALARTARVDLLFAPPGHVVYPPGFATSIDIRGITEPLEGKARGPGHFRAVAIVVAKLLNMVQPDVAYFGQKDAQQALVVRRMVRDLDIPVQVQVCPTVREADGLAMSSRNVRLAPDARERAVGLYEALREIEQAVVEGERSTAALLARGRARLAARAMGPGEIDYFDAVDAESLTPVASVEPRTLVALAVRVGGVRLIDNIILGPQSLP